jgi:hypothetical protein
VNVFVPKDINHPIYKRLLQCSLEGIDSNYIIEPDRPDYTFSIEFLGTQLESFVAQKKTLRTKRD